MSQQAAPPHGFGLFTLDRLFSAPQDLLFRALVDPALLAQWYGPAGWSVQEHTMAVGAHVGAPYRFALIQSSAASQNPAAAEPAGDPETPAAAETAHVDGVVAYINAPHELQVIDRSARAFGFPEDIRIIHELHPEGEGVRLRMSHSPIPEAAFEPMAQAWNSSLDRLTALLDALLSFEADAAAEASA